MLTFSLMCCLQFSRLSKLDQGIYLIVATNFKVLDLCLLLNSNIAHNLVGLKFKFFPWPSANHGATVVYKTYPSDPVFVNNFNGFVKGYDP